MATNRKKRGGFINMKADIRKSGDCKKLSGLNCSPTCSGGYQFTMDGEELKKRNKLF